MTEYKKLTAKECAKRLLKIEKPLILMHARPDGDTVGSGIALYRIFEALGKSPRYVSEDKIPKRLEFITEGCELATETDGMDVVAVDIASPKQAGDILSRLPKPILMIDHHDFGEQFADGYIAGGLSSAGEAVLDVCEELVKLGKIKLTEKIAYPIYAAMSSDTAGFRYSSATDSTYKKAAKLINLGIDFSDINHRLFNSKLPEQVRAEGFISSKIAVSMNGRVAYATVTKRDREEIRAPFEFFETAVDIVKQLFGVEIAFVVKETDSGEFRVSLRSTSHNVAKIAIQFGGGGHIRAAGCSPDAKSVEEAAQMILSAIEAENYFN